ncbi:peptidase family M48-domain-containing protein [Gloeopeniophorella convolvens]|nr:peptidase family M48-domain-containing protein [Gloeopeniophorella convolvens]
MVLKIRSSQYRDLKQTFWWSLWQVWGLHTLLRSASPIVALILLCALIPSASIEQVPETGRWRFMDVSVEYEAALWESSYTSLSEEYRGKILPPSHIVTQHVHRIVSRILEANNLGTLRGSPRPPVPSREVAHQSSSGFGGDGGQENAPDLWDPDAAGHGASPGTGQKEWNLLVVNDKNTVNAMAAPGTIVVFTGILPVAKDEQGLAAILSHEVGHVVARHSAESYSYMKLLIFAAYLAEVVGFSGMGDLLATLLLQLPHSRKQEYEADQIGLRLSAKACFDPTAAPEMFTRLGALEKGAGGWTPTFLRTHPLSEARVKRLQGLLPDAFALQASACGGTADFLGAFGEAVGLEQRARSSWDS